MSGQIAVLRELIQGCCRGLALAALLLLTGCLSGADRSTLTVPSSRAEAYSTAATDRTSADFEARRQRPPQLRSFLQRMPKGGDIHNHLSGAVYAENYLAWIAERPDLCVRETAHGLALLKCEALPETAQRLVIGDALQDPITYRRLIDQWSTRNLAHAGQSGHDQFFDSFGWFFPATVGNQGRMLAEVADRAAAEETMYLELMLSLQTRAVSALGAKIGLDEDLGATRERLLEAGMMDHVAVARRHLDAAEAQARELLRCEAASPDPGCDVTLRYLQQGIRIRPAPQVFAELVFAFELAQIDSRVVGVNLVAPEDNPVALADYRQHMRMIGFLGRNAPEVGVALHAGELALGLVPPEALRFHIREAIDVAGATRIGHGTDISFEDDSAELLAQMRRDEILVEICLTSSDVILEISGDEHPFQTYWESGVPLALCTDDSGVSRIDFTHEFQRAARTYGLGYRDLKELARNSLHFSFLAGKSLWRQRAPYVAVEACADDQPGAELSTSCAAFIEASAKAREQWRLENDFAEFEALSP